MKYNQNGIFNHMLIVAFLWLGLLVPVFSQTSPNQSDGSSDLHSISQFDHYFQTGNQYYQNGEYISAVQVYEKLLNDLTSFTASIPTDVEKKSILHYNLGNTYFKLHKNGYYTNQYLARSIWSYYQTLKINLAHQDAEYNLNLILSQFDEEYKKPSSISLKVQRYFAKEKSNLVHLIGILFLMLIVGFFIVKIVTKNSRFQRIARNMRRSLIPLFIIYLLLSLFSIGQLTLFTDQYQNLAVVKEESKVRSEPNSEVDNTLFLLSEGVVVTKNRISPNQKWVEIEKSHQRGWLERKQLLLVSEKMNNDEIN